MNNSEARMLTNEPSHTSSLMDARGVALTKFDIVIRLLRMALRFPRQFIVCEFNIQTIRFFYRYMRQMSVRSFRNVF